MSQKIVLFLPPYSGPLIGPPLSLLSLAGALRQGGFETRIIDSALQPDYIGHIERDIQDCPMFRDLLTDRTDECRSDPCRAPCQAIAS